MSEYVFNYLKEYNYIDDYFTTTFNYYAHAQKSFPITFYEIDKENTIWDDDTHKPETGSAGVRQGSYEAGGVGIYSGVKFKKIMMLPVHSLEQVSPRLESTEKGFTAFDSMVTSFIIPELYGLKPFEDCVVDLNHGLQNNVNRVLFQITNVSFSHYGQHMQFYRCDCRVAPFTKEDIEKQVKSLWNFYEPTKSILPSSNTLILTKILSRANTLSKNFKNDLFDNGSCMYFDHISLV